MLFHDFASLDDRSDFDLALVLNHDDDGPGGRRWPIGARMPSRSSPWPSWKRSPGGSASNCWRPRSCPSSGKTRDAKMRQIFVEAAVEGSSLRQQLGPAFGRLQDLKRIQIVTARASWFLPARAGLRAGGPRRRRRAVPALGGGRPVRRRVLSRRRRVRRGLPIGLLGHESRDRASLGRRRRCHRRHVPGRRQPPQPSQDPADHRSRAGRQQEGRRGRPQVGQRRARCRRARGRRLGRLADRHRRPDGEGGPAGRDAAHRPGRRHDGGVGHDLAGRPVRRGPARHRDAARSAGGRAVRVRHRRQPGRPRRMGHPVHAGARQRGVRHPHDGAQPPRRRACHAGWRSSCADPIEPPCRSANWCATSAWRPCATDCWRRWP